MVDILVRDVDDEVAKRLRTGCAQWRSLSDTAQEGVAEVR